MKCGKCGQNEANYYYRETVNGRTREIRLCEDCAKEEGLQSRFERGFDFPRGFGFTNSFFGDFFAPFESFFAPVAALRGKSEKEQTEDKQESRSCSEEMQQRRARNMLKQQLREAVEREDYETAITLRDQLKEMKD